MDWKVGALVTVMRDGKPISIHKIERVTATQVVLEGRHGKFRVANGTEISGDVWYSCRIVPTIQAHRDFLKRAGFVNKFRSFKWEAVDLFVLERIEDILKEKKP